MAWMEVYGGQRSLVFELNKLHIIIRDRKTKKKSKCCFLLII